MLSRRDFVKNAATASLAGMMIPAALPENKRALRIAHITDMHLDTRPIAAANVKIVLRDINAMKDKPDLIINTGDSVFRSDAVTYEQAGAQWDLLTTILKENNRIPMRSCIGNHDVWNGPDATIDATYKEHKRYYKNWVKEVLDMPNRFYSIPFKGWHFIALDSINEGGYSLDAEQASWLEKELQQIPSTTPVCIFSHVPVQSVIPLMRVLKDEKAEDVHYPIGIQHTDAFKLKDLFYKHKNIKLCLSGHTHQIDAVDFLGVKYLCGGAICGNWWGENREGIVFEEFPPAYSIIDLFPDGAVSYQRVFYKFNS